MMPDLGKYAGTVLGAYGAALVLLAALVVLTLWQGARVTKRGNRQPPGHPRQHWDRPSTGLDRHACPGQIRWLNR